MAELPDKVREQIAALQQLRDWGLQEQTHRRLSGRRYNADLKDFTDLELNQSIDWYRRKIDELLAPYEKG